MRLIVDVTATQVSWQEIAEAMERVVDATRGHDLDVLYRLPGQHEYTGGMQFVQHTVWSWDQLNNGRGTRAGVYLGIVGMPPNVDAIEKELQRYQGARMIGFDNAGTGDERAMLAVEAVLRLNLSPMVIIEANGRAARDTAVRLAARYGPGRVAVMARMPLWEAGARGLGGRVSMTEYAREGVIPIVNVDDEKSRIGADVHERARLRYRLAIDLAKTGYTPWNERLPRDCVLLVRPAGMSGEDVGEIINAVEMRRAAGRLEGCC